MTVHEVSKLTGVSIRTLQYYDKIGLLKPSAYTDAGYRLYDDTALERLQQILLFRELEFSLTEIREMLDAPDFDRNKALDQQIELLLLKKEHLEHLITFARSLKQTGGKYMDFTAFDTKKMDEYSRRAKEQWGKTAAYQEYEEKSARQTDLQKKDITNNFMMIFAEFGQMKDLNPASEQVQAQVNKLQEFITSHYYTCTKEILAGLGKMYAAGGEFTENIDKYGGDGTAVFTAAAIEIFCASSRSI